MSYHLEKILLFTSTSAVENLIEIVGSVAVGIWRLPGVVWSIVSRMMMLMIAMGRTCSNKWFRYTVVQSTTAQFSGDDEHRIAIL